MTTKQYIFGFILALLVLTGFAGMGMRVDPAMAQVYNQPGTGTKSAVILAYHRVSDIDQGYALSTQDFKDHLKYFTQTNTQFLTGSGLFQSGEEHKTLITFEGGYRSSYENAMKLLIERGIPFLLMVSPARIERGAPAYMGWDDVKALQETGLVEVGLLPNSYRDITRLDEKALSALINKDIRYFERELGTRPKYISVPHGGYSQRNLETLEKYDFKHVFGLHSGVAHLKTGDGVLPRFSLTNGYSAMERLKTILDAQPLIMTNITPADRLQKAASGLAIGFTLDTTHTRSDKALYCFASDYGRIPLVKMGESRYEIRFDTELQPGRLRINCTQACPAPENCTLWQGMMFTLQE